MLYIGLTGAVCSGKGSACDVAPKILGKEIRTLKLSDLIREHIVFEGYQVSRENYRKVANCMRQKHGPGFWMTIALRRMQENPASVVIIDGIRNIEELRVLKQQPNSYVIGFDAGEDIRFIRARKRDRDVDALSDEALMAMLREETARDQWWGFQLEECISAADFIINGGLPLEQANAQVILALRVIKGKSKNLITA